MTPDDIEQLLQQYGEDQRQQLQATETVRRMARQQGRRLTTAACVVVAMLIGGTIFFRLQPQTTPQTLTAELHKDIPMPDPAAAETPAIITPTTAAPKAIPSPRQPERPTLISINPTEENSTTEDYEPLPSHNEADPAYHTASHPSTTDTHAHTPQPRPEIELQPTLQPTNPPATQKAARRLRFRMSLGASTMGNTSLGNQKPNLTMTNSIDGIDGLNPGENATMHFSPSSTIQANVGVDYTVASNSRSRLNIGMNLSGYAQQEEVDIQRTSILYSETSEGWMCMADNSATITNTTNETINTHTLSLYAGIPLTFDILPHGPDKTGWQLSLTPARNIATTRSRGLFSPNPWKLTLGVGIVMPRGIARHISLTANLLPLYPHQSLHEMGVLIGF